MVNMIEQGRNGCAAPTYGILKTDTRAWQFMFLKNCLYMNTESAFHRYQPYNELCGLSYQLLPGIHNAVLEPGHKMNSARLMWRQMGDKIELAVLVYCDGVRDTTVLGEVETGKQYRISFRCLGRRPGKALVAIAIREVGTGKSIARHYERINVSRLGYYLNPRFGDPAGAPDNIVFYLKDLGRKHD